MKPSRMLTEAVKGFEGFRARAYRDSAGVLTIGYGHTLGVKPGDTVTEEEAGKMLEHDLWTAARFADTMPQLGTQGRYDAVVDFIFNLGAGTFRRSTLCRLITRQAPTAAVQKEFMKWVYATDVRTGKKVKLPGLVKRRQWEAERWAR